jgi:hypothetical protein
MATTVIKEALRGVLAGLAAHGQAGPAASRPPAGRRARYA